jgi:hypothetical protein
MTWRWRRHLLTTVSVFYVAATVGQWLTVLHVSWGSYSGMLGLLTMAVVG